ncbi:aldose 1-epimerase family protein [Bifidobacterium sp. CP2]|uniref:aldose 1-epimerase family protein n=1 Tax=Bifidobacterium TaxID=1678 RepID=UPI001BDD77C0|nr:MULTISPECIES: aldose 1-epimerase family protein [Bifidobacterium]MBT1181134.1 aldose 1-epimerase family protein [Bifidobacterium sp. CP2]MBW3079806.1 aldose 1-epimerase family protein [Bifidobacterium saguinibicoloris]
MSTTPRTGNQYSIHYGDYSAVVCELGAKLRRFDWRGKEIFCPFGPDDLTPTCNGYILAPWPNRIKDGEYDFNGRHYCAPVNEQHPAPRNNANHGYAYHYMWRLESLTENAVTQSLRFPNLDGYPFDVTVTATYELGEQGMTVTVSASNGGDEPAPWALGLHPWLANGKQGATSAERDADSAACHLKIDANEHVVVDAGLIPTGVEPVEGVTDLREGPTLEGRSFDDAWLDVNRAADGTTTTVFTRPDGIEVKLIGDGTINAWQCYTATGAPLEEHPYGVAVEPMTAPANAFRSGDHLTTIAPGETVTTVVRYEVTRK